MLQRTRNLRYELAFKQVLALTYEPCLRYEHVSQWPSMSEVSHENSLTLHFSTAQVIILQRVFLCAFISSELSELKVLCVDRKPTDTMKDNAKKKRMMTIEIKREIIEKYEKGVRVSELARQYDRNTSTICTIIKQKDNIKDIKPAKGLTIISKRHSDLHDEMERLLMIWIKDKQLAGDSITETIVCEKANAIYQDLKVKQTDEKGETSTSEETFKASRGWFVNFKNALVYTRL